MPDLTPADMEIVRKAICTAADAAERRGRDSAGAGFNLGVDTAVKTLMPIVETHQKALLAVVDQFRAITETNSGVVRKAMSAFVDGSGGELVRPAGCGTKRRGKKRRKMKRMRKGFVGFDPAPFGYCPECREVGWMPTPGGKVRCLNGHEYAEGDAKYSVTMIDLHGAVRAKCLSLAAKIFDQDLADDGREDDPHITVKYGIHAADPLSVAMTVRDFGPVQFFVGGLDAFYAKDSGRDYDVLIARVQSDDLYRLNAKLSELCCTDTFKVYKPHVTLAYLKPGTADRWIERLGGVNLPCDAEFVTFANPKKERTEIPLAGPVLKAVVDDDAEPDPLPALSEAVVEAVYEARKAGDDDAAQAAIDRYRELAADPGALTALLADDDGVVKKGIVYKGAEHAPAGGVTINGKKYRGGMFIPAKEMAKASPEEKKEFEEKKADHAEHGTMKDRAKRATAEKREKKKADVKRAKELADTIAGGGGTAEDHQELADHLEGLTLDQLDYLRSKVATRRGGRKKAEVVARLKDALLTGKSQAMVRRDAPKDHARLALAGFQPNRHDVLDSAGNKVAAGKGYIRYEGDQRVGYSPADAERIAAGVTAQGGADRIAMHEKASADESLDPFVRDYHAELADQLKGHHAATFGGGSTPAEPPAKPQPSLTPKLARPGGGESSNEGTAFAEQQAAKRQAESPFKPESFQHEEGYYGDVHAVKIGDATLQYQMAGNGNIELASVRVPNKSRGKGEARKAMRELLAEADRRGLGVQLIASPLDGKTRLGKLVDFYKGLGFEVTGKGNPAGDPKMVRQAKQADKLPGGDADNVPDAAVPADKLAEGQRHEMEHTADPNLAKEIAKDHIVGEGADYYDKLAKVEGGKKPTQAAKPGDKLPAVLDDADRAELDRRRQMRLPAADPLTDEQRGTPGTPADVGDRPAAMDFDDGRHDELAALAPEPDKAPEPAKPTGPRVFKPHEVPDDFHVAELSRDDYATFVRDTPDEYHVGPKSAPPATVFPGDTVHVASRGGKGWVAKLGGKDKKYGREREFLPTRESRSGMRKQIATHSATIDEPGEYEIGGDEFGKYRHTFTVTDPAAHHRTGVEGRLKAGKEVHPDVLKDYPDLAAKYAPKPAASPPANPPPAADAWATEAPPPSPTKTAKDALDALPEVAGGVYSIHELRQLMPHLSDEEFKAAYLKLAEDGHIQVSADQDLETIPHHQRGYVPHKAAQYEGGRSAFATFSPTAPRPKAGGASPKKADATQPAAARNVFAKPADGPAKVDPTTLSDRLAEARKSPEAWESFAATLADPAVTRDHLTKLAESLGAKDEARRLPKAKQIDLIRKLVQGSHVVVGGDGRGVGPR